jgi:hypothetical protein
MAAGRSAEMTQGLNVPGNIPHFASTPVTDPGSFLVQMMLIFKKTAMQQSRAIKDAIKANPTTNIPILLGMGEVIGEITGDIKQIPLGVIEGNLGERLANRGSWASDDPDIGRLIDNLTQSFALGLLADLAVSAGTTGLGLLSNVAGPALTDISKAGYRIVKGDLSGAIKDQNTALKSIMESMEQAQ